MMEGELEFFTVPGRMTSAGEFASKLAVLPNDLQSLCKILHGLLLHVFWADEYGVELSQVRREELQIRPVSRKLERILALDPRILTEPRQPEKRLVGNCRDFSVVLTSMLRQKGIPARSRCGFGCYLRAGRHVDHWVSEYWNEQRRAWVLVDSQLDDLQRERLSITFDPLDVPRSQFLVAGHAWRLCRAGEQDPETFGIFDMKGLWFVRGNLLRDLAALNGMELLPWDSWGLMERHDEELSEQELALLDQVAALTSVDAPAFDQLRRLYQSEDRLRVPDIIRSYTQDGPRTVNLSRL